MLLMVKIHSVSGAKLSIFCQKILNLLTQIYIYLFKFRMTSTAKDEAIYNGSVDDYFKEQK